MSASPNGSVTGMGELCTIHADIQQFLMKSSNPQLPLFIGLSSIGRFILFSSGYEPLDAAIQSIACESSNRANPPPSNRHGTLLFIRYLIAGYSLNVQLQFITEAGKDLNVVFDLFIRFLGTIFSVPSYWISSIGQRGFTGWELHQSRYEVGICFQTTTMPLASARLQIASQGP
ncbi:hypothetical protein BHE74_00015843 [Ensete ventricosum]|nr:hypothetical protein BHE74_00015843 [Ensete ventricosum]